MDRFTAYARPQVPPQRFQPSGKRVAEEDRSLVVAVKIAIECRPPFHEGAIAVDDRRDTQRCAEIPGLERRLADESVGLRPLHIRQRQQFLPPARAVVEDIAHGPHRIARLAGFDLARAGAVDPDRVVVEVADDFPYLVGRLFEDRAVIASRHVYAPRCSMCITCPSRPSGATRFLDRPHLSWPGSLQVEFTRLAALNQCRTRASPS